MPDILLYRSMITARRQAQSSPRFFAGMKNVNTPPASSTSPAMISYVPMAQARSSPIYTYAMIQCFSQIPGNMS